MPGYGDEMAAGGLLKSRTRELQHEDSLLSASLPPAPPLQVQLLPPPDGPPSSSALPLPTVQEHGLPTPGPSPLAFAGRPRAGTLPSTFNLASSSVNGARSRLGPTDSLLLPSSVRGGATSLPNSGPPTPLENPFPSALIPPAPSGIDHASHSRLRSGSLTLPRSGLSSAFGPGVFSSNDWAPRTPDERSSSLAVSRRLGDLKSPDDSTDGDDHHVRTLDYLGLAEEAPSSAGGSDSFFASPKVSTSRVSPSSPLSAPHAPAMQRLGSAGSIQPSSSPLNSFASTHARLRSNTVAAFPRASAPDALLHPFAPATSSYPSSNAGGPPAALHASSDDLYGLAPAPSAPYHRPSSSTDSSRLLYATAARDSGEPSPSSTPAPPLVSLIPGEANGADHLPHQRGRSATIGILDDWKGDMYPRRRAGTTAGIPPRHLGIGAGQHGAGGADAGGPVAAMANRMGRLGISEDPAQAQTGWASLGRPPTPEGTVSLTPPVQQPTRSLWVGNLDPKTTPADLQDVFAPYGAIESLRLIPDKECGFVNFVSVSDAIRAKEDVLNRLGGQLTKTSGLVRIGYGKAESTPAPTAPGLVHPRSTSGPAPTSAAELNLQTQPTRALWIGSIPPTTTPNHLLAVFSSFGPIESARVLTHKSCGFVNFERLDDAVAARKALNNREILGAEVGPIRIGFAKVPTKITHAPFANHVNGDGTPTALTTGIGSYPQVYGAVSQLSGVSGVPVERQLADGQVQDYRSNLVLGMVSNGHYASAHTFSQQQQTQHGVPPFLQDAPIETAKGSVNEMQLLMRELSQGSPDVEEHVAAVAADRPPQTYYTSIPLAVLSDPRFARRYSHNEAPRLREIRKRLDSELATAEADSIATDLMDEIVPLASDYIGNTLVQKLFEQTSKPVRKAMLERVAPHLAPIGTHKNGTWAVQKIIQCAQDEDEFALIEQSLAPYTPPLLLNDFGNYVVQGALRFGSPWSDFVFDAMVDRIWEIGSGRFGARSTRQTLENPESPALHVKRVASAIVLNAIPLATSSNGALLLTWFLEASGMPNRYSLVAPRFATHLSHLCTHKLASQSIMRVVNQREDDEAQRAILDALLDPETKVLEDVLNDQMHGVACMHKFTASTHLTDERRERLFARIKEVVDALKVQAIPAYRKLIEEVGGVYTGPPAGNTPPPFGGRGAIRTSPQQQFAGPFGAGLAPPQLQQHRRGPPPPPQPYMSPYPYGAPMSPYQPASQYGAPGPYPVYPPPYYGVPPGGPGAVPSQYNPPFSPAFGPTSAPSSIGQAPSSPAVSPLLAHPGAPFSPGLPSGTAYPSISSPDPFSALRVSTDGQVGFNPAFSPLASPQPPYYGGVSFGSFSVQQDMPGGPFDTQQQHGNGR
ncbi:uncharacterized protein JCM10292_007465 [Rhodotorula paludigena]|uniref:uncharacterized protein n=1 Tax=Rhodotorula paludigena TaxID=86838 RepID=UPI003176097A